MHGNYTRHFDYLGWWIVFLYFPVYIYRHIFNLIVVGGEAACQEARRASRCAKHARVSPASLIGNYQLSTNNSPNPHPLVFCIDTSDQFVHSSFMTLFFTWIYNISNSFAWSKRRRAFPLKYHSEIDNLTVTWPVTLHLAMGCSRSSQVKYLKDYALPLWLVCRHPFIVSK